MKKQIRLAFFLVIALSAGQADSALLDPPASYPLHQTDAASGHEAGDRYDWAVASGDFNDDGISDLVVGAPGEERNADAEAGVVFVFMGSGAGLHGGSFLDQADASRTSAALIEAGDELGHSVAVSRLLHDVSP